MGADIGTQLQKQPLQAPLLSIGERIIDEVQLAWNEVWDSQDALDAIFGKFIKHYEKVKQARGDNDF